MSAEFDGNLLVAVERALKKFPVVRRGKMFGYPAFYVGRKMFACVYRRIIGLKLPAERAAALVSSGTGFIWFQPYGRRAMREWVQVDASHAERLSRKELAGLLDDAMSFTQYVQSDAEGRK